jgi:predicted Zn-dependent protease
MMIHKQYQKTSSPIGFALCGAIASLTMTITAIAGFNPFVPLQAVQAKEAATITTKQNQSELQIAKFVGTYKTVFTSEFLANAKKTGLQSISGQWKINPNSTFSAMVNIIAKDGTTRSVATTGKVSIKNGKLISQVETINGKKPEKVAPPQSYTLLADGKTWQADGKPVQLVKQ